MKNPIVLPVRDVRLALSLCVLIVLASCKSDDTITNPVTSYHTRKNVTELSTAEKLDYVSAVKKLKTTPSPYDASISYYDQFVKWHLDVFLCDGPSSGAAHMGPALLPWHRE